MLRTILAALLLAWPVAAVLCIWFIQGATGRPKRDPITQTEFQR